MHVCKRACVYALGVYACVHVKCIYVCVTVCVVLNITCVRLSAKEVLCTGNFLAARYFPFLSFPAQIRCGIQL